MYFNLIMLIFGFMPEKIMFQTALGFYFFVHKTMTQISMFFFYSGIILMMSICQNLDVYEFIPSKRHTTLCHYYDQYHDVACTLGAYHPLFYEKVLIRRLSTVSLDELMTKGKITLPGFSQVTCSGQHM